MSIFLNDSEETQALLQKATNGDRVAMEQLFGRHLPAIRRAIGRRLRPQTQQRFDVSDVVQETQQRALEQFEDYLRRRPMPFSLWLYRSAHQRIVDLERAHLFADCRSVERELPLPESSSVELVERLLSRHPRPPDAALLQEQARAVRRCLAQLREHDREVLLLRICDGLKNADVAALLEIHPETSKKRFARALLRLRHLLMHAGLGGELP